MNVITLSTIDTRALYISISLISIMLMCGAEKSKNKKRQTMFLCGVILVLALPEMIRYDVGNDFLMFFNKYTKLTDSDSLAYIASRNYEETSAAVIFYLSRKLFGTVQGAFAFYSFLTQLFMVIGFWNFRDRIRPSAGIFLYTTQYYWRTYNLFRQALAVAIVFFALKYLWEHKNIKFIVFVLIAAVIHNTAILSLVLLLYFIPFKKKSKIQEVFLIYILPIIFLLSLNIIFVYAKRIPIISQYITLNYTSLRFSGFSTGYLIYLPKILLYIFYCIRVRDRNNNTNNQTSREECITTIFDRSMYCDILFTIMSIFMQYTARIGLYFSIAWIPAFAQLFGKKKFGLRKMSVYRFGMIVYGLLIYFSTLTTTGLQIIPYSFTI